jgi:short-subunit dehydrogenase involved in D-alanine esterification of teichoic acids
MELSGRKVLITGASSGVGHALAQRLAARGCRLVLSGRNLDRLARVAKETGGVALPADLALRGEVARVVAEISAAHADLSVLINNAGIQLNYGLGETAQEQPEHLVTNIEQEVITNLVAPMQLAALLLPQLRARAARTDTVSAIVNMTSVLALAPKKTAPVYCATKAGLRVFSQALRYQLEEGDPTECGRILVAEVMLPLVDTPMTAGRASGPTKKMKPEVAAEEIVHGLETENPQIRVGLAKPFGVIFRIAPKAAQRKLRDQ